MTRRVRALDPAFRWDRLCDVLGVWIGVLGVWGPWPVASHGWWPAELLTTLSDFRLRQAQSGDASAACHEYHDATV